MSRTSTTTPPPPTEKTTLRVDLANLTPIAREYIATAIALWTDPAPVMQMHRRLLVQGRLALAVDDGEVAWINGPNSPHNH